VARSPTSFAARFGSRWAALAGRAAPPAGTATAASPPPHPPTAPVPAQSASILTPIRRRPNYDISFTGSLYVLLIIFMYLAASNTNASLLFGVLGLMLGTLMVSLIISRLVLKKLLVTRGAPDTAVVGRPATLVYHFQNNKRFWPSISVSLFELDGVEGFIRQPTSYLLHAAAGASATVPVEVIPKRRGLHTLDHFQLATSFPFGFIKRALLRRHHDAIVVYPPLGRVDPKLLSLTHPAEKTGPTIRPQRGGDDEVYGLKEFRPGDSPRWIYWRRSAKTGVLVSKDMTQVAPPRLLLLVDTCLPVRTRAAHALVERAIAMAASLATAAVEQGLSIGLHAWAGPAPMPANGPAVSSASEGWITLSPTRGKRQNREIMVALARLPLNQTRNVSMLLDSAKPNIEPGTSVVLFTPQSVELGLSERIRGGLVVVSVESPAAANWFRFDPTINFELCLPADQEVGIAG
jgi:uncharacterized protein (DUF58 family)